MVGTIALTVSAITGKHGSIIMPRALKSRDEQQRRSRQMAEVFTPAWLVKKMNDVIDEEESHAQDGQGRTSTSRGNAIF